MTLPQDAGRSAWRYGAAIDGYRDARIRLGGTTGWHNWVNRHAAGEECGMTYLRIAAMAGLLALVTSACGGGETVETSTTSSVVFTETTTTLSATTTLAATTTTTTAPKSDVSATDTTYRVQRDLKALGFFEGQIDGVAGIETQSALRAFQTQQGIEADGEFGPQTDGALYLVLMEDKDYVEELQEQLEDLGLYTGPIDGDYGKGTIVAIEKLQGSCELEQTGVIDIATRLCLVRAG
jgi:hypothetical protein